MVTPSGLSPVLGVVVAFMALPTGVCEAETDLCGDVDDKMSLGAAITRFISEPSCTIINITGSFTLDDDIPAILIGEVDVFEEVAKPLLIHGNGHVISTSHEVSGFVVRLGGVDPTLTIDNLGMNGFSGSGALVLHSGNLVVQRSIFTGNSHVDDAAGWAGAISAFGDVTIDDSQFTDNNGDLGGALSVLGVGKVHVRNSTFARNDASSGGAVYVAAPELGAASLTRLDISQSTFHANTARGFSALSASGGLTIDFSTITDNVSETSAAVGASGPTVISRSILFGNTFVADAGSVPADVAAGTSLDLSDSLVTSKDAVWVESDHVDLDPSVITDTDPLLGLLADNGGFALPGDSTILTRSPNPLSSVLDRLDVLAPAVDMPSTDQRGFGFARIVGAAADLGAIEVQASDDPSPGEPPPDDPPLGSDPPSSEPPVSDPPASSPVLESPPAVHEPGRHAGDISLSLLLLPTTS